MNRSRLNSLRNIAAALLACAGFASCSQDEPAERGTPLPVGQYPLELPAGGLQAVATPAQPATRGTMDGDWDGVTSVKVKVNDSEKTYKVAASDDKITARLTPAVPLENDDAPFWWTSTTETKTVTAWAPSEYVLDEIIEFPSEWTKEDFAKYDIIGVRKDIGFEDRNEPLEFQHLMAKFVINLRKTPYLENAENVKVQLKSRGWSCYGIILIFKGQLIIDVPWVEGEVREYTTPYHLPEKEYEYVDFGNGLAEKPFASYTALVPPLNGKVSPLLIIEVDDIKYQLLHSSFTDKPTVEYRAGQVYTFNVTVKESGLDVTVGNMINWGTNGATGSGEMELP